MKKETRQAKRGWIHGGGRLIDWEFRIIRLIKKTNPC